MSEMVRRPVDPWNESTIAAAEEARVRDQIAKILDGMDIPRREEFETVKAMAAKAREENEELKKQIADLQARLLNTGP